jgi:predicted type IV restriction endonuclease
VDPAAGKVIGGFDMEEEAGEADLAISRDGKYLALTTKTTVVLLHAPSMKKVLTWPVTDAQEVSFMADGSRLGVREHTSVMLIKLAPQAK